MAKASMQKRECGLLLERPSAPATVKRFACNGGAGHRDGQGVCRRFASLGKAIRDRERTYGDNTRRVEDTANVIPSSHRLVILSCCRWLLSPLVRFTSMVADTTPSPRSIPLSNDGTR